MQPELTQQAAMQPEFTQQAAMQPHETQQAARQPNLNVEGEGPTSWINYSREDVKQHDTGKGLYHFLEDYNKDSPRHAVTQKRKKQPSRRRPGTLPDGVRRAIENRTAYPTVLTDSTCSLDKNRYSFYDNNKRFYYYRRRCRIINLNRKRDRRMWIFFKRSRLQERADMAARTVFRQMPNKQKRDIMRSRNVRVRIDNKVKKWYRNKEALRNDFKIWKTKSEWSFEGCSKKDGQIALRLQVKRSSVECSRD